MELILKPAFLTITLFLLQWTLFMIIDHDTKYKYDSYINYFTLRIEDTKTHIKVSNATSGFLYHLV